jgi:membrane protease YdiL (CAAX protease family)
LKLTERRIEVEPRPQKEMLEKALCNQNNMYLGRQDFILQARYSSSCEAMLRRSPVTKCFIVFAIAFGLRQATVTLFSNTPYESGLGSLASFGIALTTVLVIRYESFGFREHGFVVPKRAKRLLTVSLFLAFLYVLAVIFVPGGIAGFEDLPSATISWDLLFSGGSIFLAAFAAETTFRGYIQTDLEKAFGSFASLTLVSVMFTLYMLPIRLYFTAGLTELLYLSLPLLAESFFLCFLFSETKTLLCPIAFATTVTLLETFTPLEPTAIEYVTLISLVAYILLVPIMQMFIAEIREQNAKSEAIPELDSNEQTDVDDDDC